MFLRIPLINVKPFYVEKSYSYMSYSQNSVSVFHLFIKNLIVFLFENFDTLYSSEVYSAINKLILNWVKSWEVFCLMSLKKNTRGTQVAKNMVCLFYYRCYLRIKTYFSEMYRRQKIYCYGNFF